MTREERKQLIGEAIGEASMCWCEMPTGVFDSTRASKIVDGVVAALEKEREGEVVVASGMMEVSGGYSADTDVLFDDNGYVDFTKTINGKKGQLIFRPIKTDKEDKKGGE